MKVLLIGASGYIGSAVSAHLADAGHQVVALVRANRPDAGLEQRVGDLTDPASLTRAVTSDIDAVVNLAPPTGDAAVDAAAITALTDPLRGTGRAFVYASGVWVLGATGPAAADENAPVDPLPIVGYRPAIERQVLDTADAGVRATVIRPGIVHGNGGGIPALLVDLARKHGAPTYVGEEAVHWPMVHVDDLADLFVATVEKAPAGSLWHGVSESAVPVRDLAAAAGAAAGIDGEPRSWPLEDARAELGALFADALALDQTVSGDAAREGLGWLPRRAGAVADVRELSYRQVDTNGIEVFGAADGQQADVEAIVRFVAGVQYAQRNELVDAFMSNFRKQHPVWTTAHGKRLSGWDEIDAFTRQVLPGAMKQSTATYEVVRILFVRPDVAAVNVRQRPVTLDGQPVEDQPEGRPMYVLAKDNGRWRIAAAQNTRVFSD
ncbi:SgcJ/EcaC family oxidoreductase [Streptomyces melanogenes]|uniref:SgcJ/EcaC family oxidoreductase n=1 Tax=Streptomyces melanogenes TaxID=67326 RepID=A0ABZ1XE67_9ACTN|nr:SgcJ/EcaC family oxidoreductase [Streptomyces melanogenes]